MESKDARLFRRFDGCRFLVAFPCSIPIAEMVPPFVVLDGLNSASNVGQVLRTAYHLGINSVIVSPGAWSCLNGRACRVSMGWFYRMSFHVARPLSKAIQELKQLGVCLYVAENQFSQPVAPHQPHGDRKWALVIGSEFSGVSEEIVQECDQRVCVPQQQGHSLNVAHACSICLYELSKFNVMEWPAFHLLLELGANPEVCEPCEGQTALIMAASQGNAKAVSSLIECRARMETRCNKGLTALIAAARQQSWMVVRRLAEARANLDAVESSDAKQSPKPVIVRLAETSQWDTLIHLARHGANLEVRGQAGRTVLMYAAERGLDDVAWWLLQCRADPNAEDERGETALLKACNRQFEGFMRVLWEGGAGVEIPVQKSRIPAMARLLQKWNGHEDE
ncbi:unnamed protein product [Cladocopium goreaui]|uniref:23S rRNA (Guanosine(2553)-2'-O)-methyltransferase RlmP (23S rRNA (Guanosine-2'-O-)-methyltransferase RlmP) n=1 Tax=Cladocopium goreaui TaxID=2562237 RepID=A0A9P1CVT8_9DINO|nr:unnamed protein product [Cladocopium goreaui]